jgi:hypothetical protein
MHSSKDSVMKSCTVAGFYSGAADIGGLQVQDNTPYK